MKRLLLLLLLLPGLVLAEQSSFNVVVSIKPVHSILAALMQGGDAPQLLLAGEASPFDYQLDAAQREQVAKADLLIWTGPELEPFLAEPVAGLGERTQVVELLSHPALKVLPRRWQESQRDPFFWMDSRNILILADELARLLMRIDPNRSHLYLRNRNELHDRLSVIDRRFEYGYRGMTQGVALLYHDSLQYFAQAYAMRLGAILSPLPSEPVATEKLLKARSSLQQGEFSCLLTERGMPAPQLSLLTEGIQVNVGELDTLGAQFEPGPDFYRQLMDYNTDVIRNCLGTKTSHALPAEEDLPPSVNGLGGNFLLTDHNGNLVTEQALLGSYHLIYFGYTYCPDVCPTSLQTLNLALNLLGDEAGRFVPWLITVDPERDKVEVMREYVKYFNERMVGLTGTTAMIERVAEAYRVRYEKVMEEGGDPELYTMDHTASLFLIGPDGRFITKFAYGITAKALAERLRSYR
jgi:protein SCO1/2